MITGNWSVFSTFSTVLDRASNPHYYFQIFLKSLPFIFITFTRSSSLDGPFVPQTLLVGIFVSRQAFVYLVKSDTVYVNDRFRRPFFHSS